MYPHDGAMCLCLESSPCGLVGDSNCAGLTSHVYSWHASITVSKDIYIASITVSYFLPSLHQKLTLLSFHAATIIQGLFFMHTNLHDQSQSQSGLSTIITEKRHSKGGIVRTDTRTFHKKHIMCSPSFMKRSITAPKCADTAWPWPGHRGLRSTRELRVEDHDLLPRSRTFLNHHQCAQRNDFKPTAHIHKNIF